MTASLTKLIPFFITPMLLGAGRVRSVLVAGSVTMVAVVAVPAGLESLRFFLDFNTTRSMYIFPYVGSHSLKMLIFYLIGQTTNDFHVVTGLLIGFFLSLSIIATLYSRDLWSCSGLLCLTYFLIMTDVWEHHYTFILPFTVLAWIRGRPEDKARWIPVVLVLLMSLPMLPIVGVLSGVSLGVHPITWDPIWQILYHSSKVVPILIFYIWLFMTAFRSPRTDSFLKSIIDAFQNAWNGLIINKNPVVEGGILTNQR